MPRQALDCRYVGMLGEKLDRTVDREFEDPETKCEKAFVVHCLLALRLRVYPMLATDWCFLHTLVQIHSDDCDYNAAKERRSPDSSYNSGRGQRRADDAPSHRIQHRQALLPTPEPTASIFLRPFDHERGWLTLFAASREASQKRGHHQQHARGDADGLEGEGY